MNIDLPASKISNGSKTGKQCQTCFAFFAQMLYFLIFYMFMSFHICIYTAQYASLFEKDWLLKYMSAHAIFLHSKLVHVARDEISANLHVVSPCIVKIFRLVCTKNKYHQQLWWILHITNPTQGQRNKPKMYNSSYQVI